MAGTSVVLLSSLGVLLLLISAQSKSINPKFCEQGKEYKDCAKPCPLNCNSPNIICPGGCQPGCYCKDGTVENIAGQCVKNEECCTGNTTYSLCANNCLESCDTYLNPSITCPLSCAIGCKCKEGYQLLSDGSKCVLPQDCTKHR
ncbi:serine protease inhibitor swm-1-like [Leptodactylus fuscus]|uniref:serine protease inhibitor swm-1-like n=1 Tax=Leptodactylus fuscus TaxID=238119 RepID=UPI003F4E6EFB